MDWCAEKSDSQHIVPLPLVTQMCGHVWGGLWVACLGIVCARGLSRPHSAPLSQVKS